MRVCLRAFLKTSCGVLSEHVQRKFSRLDTVDFDAFFAHSSGFHGMKVIYDQPHSVKTPLLSVLHPI